MLSHDAYFVLIDYIEQGVLRVADVDHDLCAYLDRCPSAAQLNGIRDFVVAVQSGVDIRNRLRYFQKCCKLAMNRLGLQPSRRSDFVGGGAGRGDGRGDSVVGHSGTKRRRSLSRDRSRRRSLSRDRTHDRTHDRTRDRTRDRSPPASRYSVGRYDRHRDDRCRADRRDTQQGREFDARGGAVAHQPSTMPPLAMPVGMAMPADVQQMFVTYFNNMRMMQQQMHLFPRP